MKGNFTARAGNSVHAGKGRRHSLASPVVAALLGAALAGGVFAQRAPIDTDVQDDIEVLQDAKKKAKRLETRTIDDRFPWPQMEMSRRRFRSPPTLSGRRQQRGNPKPRPNYVATTH